MIAKKHSSLLRVVLLTSITAITLTACSGNKWGFPYKAPVQQGNWLTTAQVERLSVGMTREQVQFLLGSPTLQDIFHSDRWDYPYYHKPGSGKEELRSFTVWFQDDLLVRWEGDSQPNRQPFEQLDSGASAIQTTDNEPRVIDRHLIINQPTITHPDSAVMDAEPLR